MWVFVSKSTLDKILTQICIGLASKIQVWYCKMGGSCWKAATPLDCIRVVHLSGYVEDFEAPLTASQLVATAPKHFLFSAAHLLSFSTHPLAADVHLSPGRLYFLLPHAVFQSDSSPVDLVTLAGRLTAIAKRAGPSTVKTRVRLVLAGDGHGPYGGRKSCRASSWKPFLETIEEKSIERR